MMNRLPPRAKSELARISWREAIKRFTPIDADFVGCEIGLPQHNGFFTVSLYPWWEHPLYLEARDAGANWGFRNIMEGALEVTVCPKDVIKFQLSQQTEVVDWDFTQEHPLLWDYESHGTITCNSPVTLEQWMEIAAQVEARLAGYIREGKVANLAVKQVHQFGHTGSFGLGQFPLTVFHQLCLLLDEYGIRYYIPYEPKPKDLPVLFLIDGDGYIIANDFEVDVPDFVHKPEWFQPR